MRSSSIPPRPSRNPARTASPAPASSRATLGRWAWRAEFTRDLRLDLMRGCAVFVMIADHLAGPSWLHYVTGGNVFLVSAAEFFVFISGCVGGIAWGSIARDKGLLAAIWKILRRTATLYLLTVILTVGFGSFSILFHLPWASQISNSGWGPFIQNTVSLRQTLAFADILLLYSLLLAAAPIALWLLSARRTLWLVAGSVSMWLSFQIFGFQIPWEIPDYGFQFAAWQLLFFLGMAIGFHQPALAKRLKRLPLWPCFVVAAALFLGLILYYQSAPSSAGSEPIESSALFLKSALAPGRVVAFVVAFAFIFLGIHLFWKPIKFVAGWLLLPLGQNALYSYTLHIVLVGLYAVLVPIEWMASRDVNTVLQLIGIFAIWWTIPKKMPMPTRKENVKSSGGRIRIHDQPEIDS